MTRMRQCVVLLATLTGCGLSNGSDGYCEDLQPLESSGDVSGVIRTGYHFRAYGMSIASLSSGRVVVPTCSDLATLDAFGQPSTRIQTGQSLYVATGADDTIYATTRERHLIAAAPDGTIRWNIDLPGVEGVVPSADAIYGERTDFAGADGRPATSSLLAVDPATGGVRTISSAQPYASAPHLIGAGPAGGVVTAHETEAAVTVRHLDADGTPRWTLTATATEPRIRGAAPTDHGVILFGDAGSSIAIGDFTITGTPGHFLHFVLAADDHGVVQWGYAVDATLVSVAVAHNGDALLGATDFADSSILVARPTGIAKTIAITGDGDQYLLGVAPASDGRAWVQFSSFDHDDLSPARAQLGSKTFTETGDYLFELQL